MAPTLPAKTPTAPSPAPPPSPERRRSKRRRKTPPPPEAMVAEAEPTPSPGLLSSTERRRRKTAPPPAAAEAKPHAAEAVEPAAKKPSLFQRIWPPEDEVRILKALAAHRHAHGGLPKRAALFTALDGRLLRKGAGKRELAEKLRSLKRRYNRDSKKEAPPADKHEHRLYLLSQNVWGGSSSRAGKRSSKGAAAQDKSVGERTGKDSAQAQYKSPGEIIGKDAAQDKNTGERAGKDAAQDKSAGEQAGKDAVQADIAGERAGKDAAQDKSAGEQAGKDAVQADIASERAGKDASQADSAGERTGKDAAQAQYKSAGEEIGKDDAQDKSPGDIIGKDDAQDKNAGERAGKDATQADSAGEQIVKVAQAPKVKTLNEMRELYPYLVDEAMVLVDPAVLERTLPGIDGKEAQALNSRIKKMRKQLNRTITELARMKNMEMPTVCLCPSTRLQPEKWRAGNENKLFLERLARVEHQMVELGQILRVSRSHAKIERSWPQDISSAKGIRCESAESGLHSIVSENQIPPNILQKKIEASNILLPGKTDEKLQVIMQPEKFPGRRKKLKTESQTLPNVIEEMKVTADAQQDLCHDRNRKGEKEVVLLSIVRLHTPVAKAILQPSSQSTKVGDTQLGSQYCKVFVNDVLQRDAPLSRPYGKMMKMIDALKCSIAWPRELIRDNTIAGMAAPDKPSH